MDVSVLIPFHEEGELACRTLASVAENVRIARTMGLRVESIALLDDANDETRRAVNQFLGVAIDRIEEVQYRDLGMTRNHGASLSGAKIILMLDGDDYISRDYIVRGWHATHRDQAAVYHPEYVVSFGKVKTVTKQLPSDDASFSKECMLRANQWNSCVMGWVELFKAVPYQASHQGFGFEDWQWNCETLAAGIQHRIISGGIHFSRVKDSGSLNALSAEQNRVIAPTMLFSKDE